MFYYDPFRTRHSCGCQLEFISSSLHGEQPIQVFCFGWTEDHGGSGLQRGYVGPLVLKIKVKMGHL